MKTVTAIHPIVRPFRPEDAVTILNRDGAQIAAENIIEQAQRGPSFTAVVNERAIACGGIVIPWPGAGAAWMVLSEEAGEHWIWLSKTTKRMLRLLVREHELHRVEALALAEQLVNHRWLHWMGFTQEQFGVARNYLSDRRAMIRYEWIGD